MEVLGSIPSKPIPYHEKASQDVNETIKELKREKTSIQEQLRKLAQNKQTSEESKIKKQKLQTKLKEIDQQIQMLEQQKSSKTQKSKNQQTRAPRYDEYVKDNKQKMNQGIYQLKQQKDGKAYIEFHG